jgi:hypothetical protein
VGLTQLWLGRLLGSGGERWWGFGGVRGDRGGLVGGWPAVLSLVSHCRRGLGRCCDGVVWSQVGGVEGVFLQGGWWGWQGGQWAWGVGVWRMVGGVVAVGEGRVVG